MRFFDIQIRNITAYGIIYSNGMYEVNMWDFPADEYWFREGRMSTMQAAWRQVFHLAREMDRFNHYVDLDAGKEVKIALDNFFDYFEVDQDFDDEIASLDELTLMDEEWA